MQMPQDTALWLQKHLLGLDHEDWGLVYMLYGNLASTPPDTPARWQLSVDLIYRGLVSGLVAVNDLGATSDQASFLHAIRTLDPCGDGAGFWHATLVWGTERLSKLIKAHFQPGGERSGKLNPAFIEELETIFAQNGVPWSDKPLLPITPSAANSQASASS
jgi:hypothetical protein